MRHTNKKNSNVNKKENQRNGVVRIIGGQYRGRKLKFQEVEGLRPTLDRTRETLFNWLAKYIHGSRCLDLFAGSGALGFEAASHGASHVTMVEMNKQVSNNLEKNCQLIQADNIEVINWTAEKFLATSQQKYDLIFLDPPFGKGLLPNILEQLPQFIMPNALVYIEQEQSQTMEPNTLITEFNNNWNAVKFKKTKSFSYGLYQLKID